MTTSSLLNPVYKDWLESVVNPYETLTLLEKSEVSDVALSDISEALEEYVRLFQAEIASPAEILTLSRAYPDEEKYSLAVIDKELDQKEPVVIGGPASVEVVDREGHIITLAAMTRAFERFMANFRTRNAMVLHSDVQVGWALPAYISKTGKIYKSGVTGDHLFFITELRDDTKIAKKVLEQISTGKMKSYSIAGSATSVEPSKRDGAVVMQVNDMELAEVTICEQGVNQRAKFELMKSATDRPTSSCVDGSCLTKSNEHAHSNTELFVNANGIIDTVGSFTNWVQKEEVMKSNKSSTDALNDYLIEKGLGDIARGAGKAVGAAVEGVKKVGSEFKEGFKGQQPTEGGARKQVPDFAPPGQAGLKAVSPTPRDSVGSQRIGGADFSSRTKPQSSSKPTPRGKAGVDPGVTLRPGDAAGQARFKGVAEQLGRDQAKRAAAGDPKAQAALKRTQATQRRIADKKAAKQGSGHYQTDLSGRKEDFEPGGKFYGRKKTPAEIRQHSGKFQNMEKAVYAYLHKKETQYRSSFYKEIYSDPEDNPSLLPAAVPSHDKDKAARSREKVEAGKGKKAASKYRGAPVGFERGDDEEPKGKQLLEMQKSHLEGCLCEECKQRTGDTNGDDTPRLATDTQGRPTLGHVGHGNVVAILISRMQRKGRRGPIDRITGGRVKVETDPEKKHTKTPIPEVQVNTTPGSIPDKILSTIRSPLKEDLQNPKAGMKKAVDEYINKARTKEQQIEGIKATYRDKVKASPRQGRKLKDPLSTPTRNDPGSPPEAEWSKGAYETHPKVGYNPKAEPGKFLNDPYGGRGAKLPVERFPAPPGRGTYEGEVSNRQTFEGTIPTSASVSTMRRDTKAAREKRSAISETPRQKEIQERLPKARAATTEKKRVRAARATFEAEGATKAAGQKAKREAGVAQRTLSAEQAQTKASKATPEVKARAAKAGLEVANLEKAVYEYINKSKGNPSDDRKLIHHPFGPEIGETAGGGAGRDEAGNLTGADRNTRSTKRGQQRINPEKKGRAAYKEQQERGLRRGVAGDDSRWRRAEQLHEDRVEVMTHQREDMPERKPKTEAEHRTTDRAIRQNMEKAVYEYINKAYEVPSKKELKEAGERRKTIALDEAREKYGESFKPAKQKTRPYRGPAPRASRKTGGERKTAAQEAWREKNPGQPDPPSFTQQLLAFTKQTEMEKGVLGAVGKIVGGAAKGAVKVGGALAGGALGGAEALFGRPKELDSSGKETGRRVGQSRFGRLAGFGETASESRVGQASRPTPQMNMEKQEPEWTTPQTETPLHKFLDYSKRNQT